MNSTVTFKNLGFLDSRSIEQAAGILWAAHRHAKQSVEMFGESEAEVRERLARPHAFTLLDPGADQVARAGLLPGQDQGLRERPRTSGVVYSLGDFHPVGSATHGCNTPSPRQ
jgi:hypothetical protein